MIVLVCGGRSYPDKGRVYDKLNQYHKKYGITEVVNGGAPGTDRYSSWWARENNVVDTVFEAQWKRDKLAAGPLRNQAMLKYVLSRADGVLIQVLAFPGGAGTADMVHRAKNAGIPVDKIDWEPL